MNYYLSVLKNYAVFTGRTRRSEYWFFVLFNLLIAFVLGIIDGMLNLTIDENTGVLSAIYSLAVLIPSIAVMVRRLHDINRTGWWVLIGLVPIIGGIVLIVFAIQNSTPGVNRFGANPKDSTSNMNTTVTEQASTPITDTTATVASVPEVQPEAISAATDAKQV